jgi:hypothetical protein
MHLVIGDHTLSVRQIGPDFLILETPIEHPPAMATLLVPIDGNMRERQVQLPAGVSARSRRVVIANA